MLSPKTAILLESRELAPEVRHFVFRMEDCESFSYVPGQFVSFTAEINGSDITRAYSFASPPCGNRFELCLNRVQDGHMSPYLFEMRPGARIRAAGPYGGFIFRQPVEDSVLVAAGAGVAPFRAMLQDQLAKDAVHRFTLILGSRYERTLLYGAEFEHLAARHPNFRFWPTLSRPEPEWTGRVGYVQRHLFEAVGERRDLNVFVCGLAAMVNEVKAMLKAAGFDRKRIICEKYD
ncbi:MAG TPA: FAD-dependent oxidoreductase [Bryobacteraceae bacterium]|jgi:ferredoxin-NADP reductase|nr:FAD-dependent oxidoreductase [Bryobacteraceae bacterium]